MSRWTLAPSATAFRGGNGTVEQVVDATGAESGLFARKTLLPSRFDRYDRFQREARIAARLDHPAILRVVDAHLPTTPTDKDPPYIVTRWAAGGTLQDRIDDQRCAGQWRDVLQMIECLADALVYMHGLGFWHRDIKPRNVVVDQGSAYLTDFGLCFQLDDLRLTRSSELVGSVRYVAPEYLEGRLEVMDHGPGDVFSLGKTIWALIAGRDPPEGVDLRYPEHNLINAFGKELELAQALVQLMTRFDRGARPSAAVVRDELRSALQPSTPSAPVSNAEAVARALVRMRQTAPAVAAEELAARARTERDAKIRDILRTVHEILETHGGLGAMREVLSGEDVGQIVIEAPYDGFRPHVAAEIEAKYGLSSDRGIGTSVIFSPSPILQERLPTLRATWVLRHHDGDRVFHYACVYAIHTQSSQPWRGSFHVEGLIAYPRDVDAPSLRRSLVGSVDRQVETFIAMLGLFLDSM